MPTNVPDQDLILAAQAINPQTIIDAILAKLGLNANNQYITAVNEISAATSFPSGHVIYSDSISVTPDASLRSTATSYTDTGLSLTIPANIISSLSKVLVFTSTSLRINKNTWTHAQYRLIRASPVLKEFESHVVGSVDTSSTEVYHSVSASCCDETLSNAQHRYSLQFRKAHGFTAYGGTMYYRYGGGSMHVLGIS